MTRDRRRTGAVQPEAFAGLGAHGDEALAIARLCQLHHPPRGRIDRGLVVAHQIGEEHHLGQLPAIGLGGVIDGAHVTLVEVLEARDLDTRGRVHEVLDLDDRGHGQIQIGPEELETQGADVLRHPMQHEARRGDDAVTALLLDTGEPREELVRHVLAEPELAKDAARHAQGLGRALRGDAVRLESAEPEAHLGWSWILPRL